MQRNRHGAIKRKEYIVLHQGLSVTLESKLGGYKEGTLQQMCRKYTMDNSMHGRKAHPAMQGGERELQPTVRQKALPHPRASARTGACMSQDAPISFTVTAAHQAFFSKLKAYSEQGNQ